MIVFKAGANTLAGGAERSPSPSASSRPQEFVFLFAARTCCLCAGVLSFLFSGTLEHLLLSLLQLVSALDLFFALVGSLGLHCST